MPVYSSRKAITCGSPWLTDTPMPKSLRIPPIRRRTSYSSSFERIGVPSSWKMHKEICDSKIGEEHIPFMAGWRFLSLPGVEWLDLSRWTVTNRVCITSPLLKPPWRSQIRQPQELIMPGFSRNKAGDRKSSRHWQILPMISPQPARSCLRWIRSRGALLTCSMQITLPFIYSKRMALHWRQ